MFPLHPARNVSVPFRPESPRSRLSRIVPPVESFAVCRLFLRFPVTYVGACVYYQHSGKRLRVIRAARVWAHTIGSVLRAIGTQFI